MKMVRPYLHAELSGQRRLRKDLKILDPGAGSGALLESIYEIYAEGLYDWRSQKEKARKEWSQNVFACEIQEDLQHILIGKGVNLIASDFLQLETPRKFDLIVMNPPFANGAKHILHAWKFIDEGNLVALVNSETIKNTCDQNRQLLAKLIEDNNGTVEDAGQVFRDAERRAKVIEGEQATDEAIEAKDVEILEGPEDAPEEEISQAVAVDRLQREAEFFAWMQELHDDNGRKVQTARIIPLHR